MVEVGVVAQVCISQESRYLVGIAVRVKDMTAVGKSHQTRASPSLGDGDFSVEITMPVVSSGRHGGGVEV